MAVLVQKPCWCSRITLSFLVSYASRIRTHGFSAAHSFRALVGTFHIHKPISASNATLQFLRYFAHCSALFFPDVKHFENNFPNKSVKKKLLIIRQLHQCYTGI